MGLPSMFTSRSTKAAEAPRSTTISFKHTCVSPALSSTPFASTTYAHRRLLGVKKNSPRTTSSIAVPSSNSSKAVRKPNDPMAKEITGGTALGNKLLTHKIVPSPPRQIMKSIFLSSPGSSSSCQVTPTPVSQCTAGSTHGVMFFFCKIRTTSTSALVVFLSFGFLTISTFFGGASHANCECGVPICVRRIALSSGVCTSHPSSLHSNSWNGAFFSGSLLLLVFSPLLNRDASESSRLK
mmetsp:Transcript_6325/g.21198  ORF Transcript_6325/g.21198 Transcript_6325/m.21198 type:complete len:239 (+) Transcript_6325:2860-3576(+)